VNAKKERKAARRAAKLSAAGEGEGGDGGGMAVDDVGEAMAFTFTA